MVISKDHQSEKEMHVKGLMNMQYAIEDDKVYVLEAKPTCISNAISTRTCILFQQSF